MAPAQRDDSDAPPRTNLTPDAVVEQALSLADSAGLEAVTVRRLAKLLGVTPMALYWHFRGKDELLDAMAARLAAQIDLTLDASAAWQEQLRALLGSVIDVLRANPSVAPLLSTRTVSSESGLRLTETALDILGRAGFPPAEATQVARHAFSTVADLVGRPPGVVARAETDDTDGARRRARLYLESLPPGRYPRLIEAAAPLSEGVEPDTHFAFGLDLLLSGIEAMAAPKR